MYGTGLKRQAITVPLHQKSLDDDSVEINTSSSVSYHSSSSGNSHNIVSFNEFKQKSLQFLMASKGHTRRHSSHENSSLEHSDVNFEPTLPTRPKHARQKSSPDVSGIQGEEVQICMIEIKKNIEREKDTKENLKRRLRQQVLKRFYAAEDNDTDRQNDMMKRCSSSETLNGPGSSFTLTQELSLDSRSNRESVTRAIVKTASAHKEQALRALSKHTGNQFRIVLKSMKFEGLYAEDRPGLFKKLCGLKLSPEFFSAKQVTVAYSFSGNHFVTVDKRAHQVDAVALSY
mmetsp:Transcript_20922/g.38773  ORF Transcript_20922/g.38773 Transcript_20922/m.38773 type:complete len:288 (-) Transcript_20922:1916-2779(-)